MLMLRTTSLEKQSQMRSALLIESCVVGPMRVNPLKVKVKGEGRGLKPPMSINDYTFTSYNTFNCLNKLPQASDRYPKEQSPQLTLGLTSQTNTPDFTAENDRNIAS